MIRVIRGQQVMIDRDLAQLYGVETKRLNEQVKRNIERFPDDFMFQLNKDEVEILKSQNATSSWGGDRRLPYAFTEQGIAMLSSVLKSQTAVDVNIRIMRAFVSMRRFRRLTNVLMKCSSGWTQTLRPYREYSMTAKYLTLTVSCLI